MLSTLGSGQLERSPAPPDDSQADADPVKRANGWEAETRG